MADQDFGPPIERMSGPELDDIVRLGAEICDTPIALVTVVRDGALTLEAHLGFDACHWPLEAGFCPTCCAAGLP